MHPEFLPKDTVGKMAHVIEEAGEVLVAIGKVQRFGLTSVDPKLPTAQQVNNRDALVFELEDLMRACAVLLRVI